MAVAEIHVAGIGELVDDQSGSAPVSAGGAASTETGGLCDVAGSRLLPGVRGARMEVCSVERGNAARPEAAREDAGAEAGAHACKILSQAGGVEFPRVSHLSDHCPPPNPHHPSTGALLTSAPEGSEGAGEE